MAGGDIDIIIWQSDPVNFVMMNLVFAEGIRKLEIIYLLQSQKCYLNPLK